MAIRTVSYGAIGLALLCGCAREASQVPATPVASAAAAAVPVNAQRDAYFGDLHVHTRWSFDAYSLNAVGSPEDAYRYARGEAIPHVSGDTIRMHGPPLDFLALTEHAGYMGVSTLVDENSPLVGNHQLIQDLRSDDPAISSAALGAFARSLSTGEGFPELLRDEVVQPVWRRIVEMADAHNQPGVFTAFVGFEWTSMPDGQNLHRNLVFRGNDVPDRPFSSLDSLNPEDLWAWMERARAEGDDVIAIPHNANASNGLMYATTDWSGDPIDAAYAEVRMRNEPVSELYQIKGTSETHPVLASEDEWANFELFDRVLGHMMQDSKPHGSYVREALKDGLLMQRERGINPYRMGVVGSSDGHNASMPVEEDNYTGKIGIADHTPERRLKEQLSPNLPLDAVSRWGAAGLAGVWAESNTREAIFDALRRRESFATSGPRMRLRMFGGWDFTSADLDGDPVASGDDRGVPMGGELADAPDGAAPTFMLWALRDPNEAPLARLQIIKGWADADGAHERVVDVACADGAPADGRCAGDGVGMQAPACDLAATRGAGELRALWRDPDFDPGEHAFYYARVLQVPTCRWSTYQSRALGMEPPSHVPALIQERAAGSAIFYDAPRG